MSAPPLLGQLRGTELRCSAQAVADAANRLDSAGGRAELAAEGAHDDVDDVAAAVVLRSPHDREQIDATDRLPRAFVERFQNAELERRQLDAQTLDIDGAVVGVEQGDRGMPSSAAARFASQPSIDSGPKSSAARWKATSPTTTGCSNGAKPSVTSAGMSGSGLATTK